MTTKTVRNMKLNAYVTLPPVELFEDKEQNTVELGFYDDGDSPMFVPLHLLTEGYHYTHGGEQYKELCRFAEEEAVKAEEEYKKEQRKRHYYVKVKRHFYGPKIERSFIGPFADMAQAIRYCAYANGLPYELSHNESGRPEYVVVRRDKVADAEEPDYFFEAELLKRGDA